MGKRGPKSKAERGGRPTKMTPETIGKLEQAFSMGCGDLEACLYADINPDTLYEFQKKTPGYSDRKRLLKEKVVLKARSEVIKGLDNNPEFSLKVLERVKKDEFSTRQEQTGANGEQLKIVISRDDADL